MRKLALFVVALAAFLAGCSASAPVPVDLTGAWASTTDTPQFEATIGTDLIEIYIVSDATKALYWKGTFPATGVTEGSTITSVADTEALSGSILGSGDAEKVFTYTGGHLVFSFTAVGVTQDITLAKG